MIINRRFEVNAPRNEVLDKRTGASVRLEPRLMKLLCLLIENRGQLVERTLIIKQIWNDYPGAGDGLNQAISGLRKLLADDQKKIIETLPKSGYCFHGTVYEIPEATPAKQPARSFKTAYIPAGILIIIALLLLARYYQSTEASIAEQKSREEMRNLSRIDSAQQAARLKASGIQPEP